MLFDVVVVPVVPICVDGLHGAGEHSRSSMLSPAMLVVPVAVSAVPCEIELPAEKVSVTVVGEVTVTVLAGESISRVESHASISYVPIPRFAILFEVVVIPVVPICVTGAHGAGVHSRSSMLSPVPVVVPVTMSVVPCVIVFPFENVSDTVGVVVVVLEVDVEDVTVEVVDVVELIIEVAPNPPAVETVALMFPIFASNPTESGVLYWIQRLPVNWLPIALVAIGH
jgi:hypothetical protein